MTKFIVIATIEIYAATLAEAGQIVHGRMQLPNPQDDRNMVLIQDMKITRAKDQR